MYSFRISYVGSLYVSDINDLDVLIASFSNSGINKVAMVKNALLTMSLYYLLCVNEIIRCHLHIVDMNDAI